MVVKANIWLLDEPSVGLDSKSLDLLISQITKHRSSGGVVVVSTHMELDIEDAETLNVSDYTPTEGNL